MNRPTFWILNPLHEEYNKFPKKTSCIFCEFIPSKAKNKHSIKTILYNDTEKKYLYNLRIKQLINKCKN